MGWRGPGSPRTTSPVRRRIGQPLFAVLSTVLFGVFHVCEVHTLTGAIILAVSVGVLGLCNCYLVRITRR